MERKTVKFMLLTFSIMLVCWGSCVILGQYGITLERMSLVFVPYILGGLSPTIASAIVDERGVLGWLKEVFALRQRVVGYVLVIIVTAIYLLTQCLVCGYQLGAPIYVLIVTVPLMLFGGGLEETGWRGVMQPELEKKLPFLTATLITATTWWLWHLPLFYIPGVGQYGADFLAYGINVLGLSFALATVRKITGSTWLCVLLHCLINASQGVFLIQSNFFGNTVTAGALIVFSWLMYMLRKRIK